MSVKIQSPTSLLLVSPIIPTVTLARAGSSVVSLEVLNPSCIGRG